MQMMNEGWWVVFAFVVVSIGWGQIFGWAPFSNKIFEADLHYFSPFFFFFF